MAQKSIPYDDVIWRAGADKPDVMWNVKSQKKVRETNKQRKRMKEMMKGTKYTFHKSCAANLRLVWPSPWVALYRFISSVWPWITPEDQAALLRCKSDLAQQEQDHKTNGVKGQRSMGRKLKTRQPPVISLSTLEDTVGSLTTGLKCGFQH